jgi:hypothetical protein
MLILRGPGTRLCDGLSRRVARLVGQAEELASLRLEKPLKNS